MPAPYTIQFGPDTVAISAPKTAPNAVPAKRCHSCPSGCHNRLATEDRRFYGLHHRFALVCPDIVQGEFFLRRWGLNQEQKKRRTRMSAPHVSRVSISGVSANRSAARSGSHAAAWPSLEVERASAIVQA